MRLFLISRPKELESSWDEYDSAVVCAETKHEARNMHPRTGKPIAETEKWQQAEWIPAASVQVKYIGQPAAHLKKGVILASFIHG